MKSLKDNSQNDFKINYSNDNMKVSGITWALKGKKWIVISKDSDWLGYWKRSELREIDLLAKELS